jgi:hypothetical protein
LDHKGGIEGCQAVVKHVYALFGITKIPYNALNPEGLVPTASVMLNWASPPALIDDYTGLLWDRCFANSESSFVALYTFTQVWSWDIGPGKGAHSIPLKGTGKQGDLTSWKVVWRQWWYLGVVAQVVTMTPVIFSAFIAGVLG